MSTNAGNWYAHRDGLEPNEETMDAQETGLNSGKMLDREIHAQKDGLGVNEDDIEEVRERRLKSSKMLVREIDDAQEDGSKSSKMLIGDTVGQEDGLKYSKRLVGDIEAQERGLEPNGESRETQEKRFNASRMLDGETDFQEMELRTSKMLKGDIVAHEEGFTRLGREARIEGICTERLRGATTRIHICGRIFFIQERREERGDPREDRIREIKTMMKLDLESHQSTGNFYCCQDTDTSAQWAQTTGNFYFSNLSTQWASRWSNLTILGQNNSTADSMRIPGQVEATACSTRVPGHTMIQDGHAWGRGVREDVARSGASAALCSTLGDGHNEADKSTSSGVNQHHHHIICSHLVVTIYCIFYLSVVLFILDHSI